MAGNQREQQIKDLEARIKGNPDFDQEAILARLKENNADRLAALSSPKTKTVEAKTETAKTSKEAPPPPNLPVEEPRVEKKPTQGEPGVPGREMVGMPSYQPKFLTPEFLHVESDMQKVRTAFSDEGIELRKVDAQTRAEFWRYLLSILKKEDVDYDYKKMLVEDYLEQEKYQPKIITPGFLQTEDDMYKIRGAFTVEAAEMEAKKVDAQTRIDFWQHALSILKKWDREYKHKKDLIEEQIGQVKSALATKELEAGLERGEREMEAELGPRHEPRFLTLKKFREEEDIKEFLEVLRFEDGELTEQNASAGQRIEFWQRLLTGLLTSHPLYKIKKAAAELRLRRAEGRKNFEETIDRETEEFVEKSEEAKETKFASRVSDIMHAEGVDEAEARKRAKQEMEEGEVKEEEEKEKLKKLEEARERLIEAKKNLQKYKGLMGRLKGVFGGGEKAAVETEVETAEVEFKKAKAEWVAVGTEKTLRGGLKAADKIAREQYEKRGAIYRAWKWLGDRNVGRLIGEGRVDSAILRWEAWANKSRARALLGPGKLGKIVVKAGLRFLSLRTAVSGAMLGGSVVLGAMGAAAGGVALFAGRRVLAGLGSGFTSFDIFTNYRLEKEKGGPISDEELNKLSIEEVLKRKLVFETADALKGKDVSENKQYLKLVERYFELNQKEVQEKGNAVLEEMLARQDEVAEKVERQSKRDKKIGTAIGLGLGLLAGSGAVSKLLSGRWGWEQFTEERGAQIELRREVGHAAEAPTETPSVVPTEAPSVGPVGAAAPLEFPAEEVAGRLGLPKESLTQFAGPDGKLTVEQVSELEAQVKSVAQAVEQAPISPEAKQAVVGAAVENDFLGQAEMARILEKVDPDHLREAGILKPDNTYDMVKLREVVNAHTLTIDKKGEGIYKTLRDYYSAPPERGGLGLSGRELRAKIVEQMRNSAFFKDGKLQDLVELGDQIKVDSKGNVLLFVAEDGKMARTRDILDLVSERAFRSGNRVFEVAPDVHLREALHPIDGHAVIKLTDAAGNTHTISDWSVGRTARIDGHREVLEDWLKRNNLLAEARGATPAVPSEELGGASGVRHEILLDEPRRLRDGYQSLAEAHEANHEAAAQAAEEQIGVVQGSTGINPEAAAAGGEAVVSSLESQIMEHATAYNNVFHELNLDLTMDDIKYMGVEELHMFGDNLQPIIDDLGSDSRVGEALHDLVDYLYERQEVLESGGGGGVAATAAEETAASVPDILHSGQPVQFGDAQIIFDYDVFNNPLGVRISGTPNIFRAESLLNGDWATKAEQAAGVGLDDARTEVMSVARELEMRERLLEGLERSGLGQSPEAEFLRKSTKMLIENTEERYGDVFRE